MSQTAMAVAFAAAGHITPRDRIDQLVRAAINKQPTPKGPLQDATFLGEAAE